jgi:hypothetical protein
MALIPKLYDVNDPLNPARGTILGIICGAGVWAFLLFLCWWLWL